ncbi:FadR/GntR family transcriptional regulator [Cytobacillus sp. FSL W7-1323]|uniref:GntR family transcriptional regulator n=1 Tax=Cytobacillus kochii TaxID=859143 RepID=A0A248TEE6_9BACI|nr:MULTISPECIES: FadR/GntR family transcriptional regulator [Cytobacillus]ASV66557.1 GntR family transcriptional regulator [Cytobacillus kochii]MDQ0186791.1 GntR family transcriptional repressor for pyruvate dehydrogenase complex [Cytobacillus kochii]MEA1854305.1 FadR/GntR family transcriptional regulator [Cytobacillus sp. OWB-43]
MKIERKKISAQVLEQLNEKIKSKEFPPNQPLPSENELAKLFGVSRAPVREALSVLSASGIIESRQGGRSYVKELHLVDMMDRLTLQYISLEEVFELLELRMIMETEAAALAANRRDSSDLEKIKKALKGLEETLTNPDEVGLQADLDFHKYMIEATKNSFMVGVMDNIGDLYRKAVAFSLKKNLGLQRKRESVYLEHEAIYKAIESQDEENARKAMKNHLQNVRKKLREEK